MSRKDSWESMSAGAREGALTGRMWAVEFDGPSHFMPSGSPTGATVIKRRQLELLGYALVSMPYWEWDRLGKKGSAREEYLRVKTVPQSRLCSLCRAAHTRK